ncbi:MAG: DMT family transporter [Verrucomicrobiota bacterium]
MKNQIRWSVAMLLMVSLVWGTSYGIAKESISFYPVLGFLAIRFCLTFFLLLPLVYRTSVEELKTAFVVGFPIGLLLLGVFVCETYGVSKTRASNASFLVNLWVVFTPWIEWIALKVRPQKNVFILVALSFIGAFLLTGGISVSFNLGDGLIVIAALLRACVVTYTKKRTAGKSISSMTLTAVQIGTVGFGSLLLSYFLLPQGLPSLPTSLTFWLLTLYLVLFCTIFSFFAQNYAVQRISPTYASLVMGSEPVFGALFAIFWLHESLTLTGWIGGILILFVSIWASMKHPLEKIDS